MSFEYKSIRLRSNLKRDTDLTTLDGTINDSAKAGWELVATTPVAYSMWDYGKTTSVVLTFRRPKKE